MKTNKFRAWDKMFKEKAVPFIIQLSGVKDENGKNIYDGKWFVKKIDKINLGNIFEKSELWEDIRNKNIWAGSAIV